MSACSAETSTQPALRAGNWIRRLLVSAAGAANNCEKNGAVQAILLPACTVIPVTSPAVALPWSAGPSSGNRGPATIRQARRLG